MKMYKPTNDHIFKKIFGEIGNENITKSFLMDILGIEIESLTIDKSELIGDKSTEDKTGILDVRVSTDKGEKIDIEIQVVKQDDIIERMLWYWARLFSSELKAGYSYRNVKKTICILIADFEIDRFKED